MTTAEPMTNRITPTFQKLSDWLADINRSYGWYRDAVANPQRSPRVPPLIKQGRNNFIRYSDGENYKREILKSAGIRTVGRPHKTAPVNEDECA